jgi:hypothetical protein
MDLLTGLTRDTFAIVSNAKPSVVLVASYLKVAKSKSKWNQV